MTISMSSPCPLRMPPPAATPKSSPLETLLAVTLTDAPRTTVPLPTVVLTVGLKVACAITKPTAIPPMAAPSISISLAVIVLLPLMLMAPAA